MSHDFDGRGQYRRTRGLRGETIDGRPVLLRTRLPDLWLGPAERSFTCLGTEDNGRLRLRKLVAEVRPELVPRAARILLKAGRCDAAMGLADAFLDVMRSLNLLGSMGRSGSDGHGADICRAALGTIDAEDPAPEPTPAEALGVYLAASACPIQSSLAIWHRSSSAGANGRPAK